MKLNRILFAASASLATMLIFSCGNHDHEEPWILSLSSGSVAGLSSSSSVRSSSSRVILYSSSEDENLSSSSDGGLVACGLYVACPSSSSSAEETSSSSSLAQCGGKLYIPPNQKCEGDVIMTECGIGWYDATNQSCGAHGVVMTKCGEDGWYNAANQQCGAGNVIETKCGSVYYDSLNTNLRCHNSVIETKCGINSWYDALNANLRCCRSGVVKAICGDGLISLDQFCFEGSGVDKCGTRKEEFDPDLYECGEGTESSWIYLKNGVSDGTNSYKAVLIGKQTWMAENLNYNVSGSFCLAQWEPNCDIYGRLYNWTTALTVCPNGWHIPSNAEWDELMEAVGGEEIAGIGLKATIRWNAIKSSYVGTDDYGFSALPGSHGEEANGNYFPQAGKDGYWWSADEYGTNTPFAYYLNMEANQDGMSRAYHNKALLFSVRCVKN